MEKFTWTIESFSKKNTKKLRSKSFQVGGCKWRIVVHPVGKGVEHLSLYLKVGGSLPPFGWTKFVYFKLAVINRMDSQKSVVRETQQRFNAGHRSWGSSFLHLSDFYDPKQGYLMNNICIIEAHVSVSDVAFNIQDKLTIIPTPISTSPNHMQNQDQETECLDETLSSTTQDSKWDQAQEDLLIGIPILPTSSDETPSPKIVNYVVPSAPPLYPCIYDDGPSNKEVPLIPLSEVLDVNSLGPQEASFVPLLEEVISWYPLLIQSQIRKSPKFRHWAFIALGQVLFFLKTTKVKNMDEDNINQLQCLWEELQLFGFDLTWLEPRVRFALDAKAYLEKVEQVKNVKENVVDLEIEMKRLRARLAVTQIDLEVARRDLEEVQKGFQERDMDEELGYGMS